MGKASQKLTTGGYLKNDATDIRSSVLQDNVSLPQYFSYTHTRAHTYTDKSMSINNYEIITIVIALTVKMA